MTAVGADAALDRWCARWLGSGVSEVLFEAGSLSAVTGVRLADGREVVVKARPSAPRLRAAYAVHRRLWRSGYPAPEPLVPPAPIDEGRDAGAEQLVRGGEIGVRTPADAARSARALAELVRLAASAGDVGTLSPSPSWVAWDHDGPGTWPPTDTGTDALNGTPGPAWLEDAATRCRRRLARHDAPRVLGHADWHADNVRWSDGTLLVVHDWDSVVSQPEAVIAGIAAAIHPASAESWHPATVEETAHFLTAYAEATPNPWTRNDTEAAWAASLWTLAVDAQEQVATGSTPTLTEQDAADRLTRADA